MGQSEGENCPHETGSEPGQCHVRAEKASVTSTFGTIGDVNCSFWAFALKHRKLLQSIQNNECNGTRNSTHKFKFSGRCKNLLCSNHCETLVHQ